jgi:RNA polymerase sigma-70 factor (ECF subfamily)
MTGRCDELYAPTPSSISSSTLERLRHGDHDSWNRLATNFAPLVYRWALRTGLNREDARDVVQDVFRVVAFDLRAFRREGPSDTFIGWLFGITRNKIADQFRRARRQPQAAGGSDAARALHEIAATEPMSLPSPDDGVRALYDRVLSLIRAEFRLTDWRAFLRVVLDGEAPAEVARELRISVNSVYLAKSRILKRLRDELGEAEA